MFVVTISGVNKTREVEAYSLNIQNILTNKRDACDFTILQNVGSTYVPKLGNEVVITDNGTKIFAGVITEMDSSPVSFGVVRHNVVCQDYTRLLDKRLVPDSFTNQTVDQIMQFLKDNYFPAGFTINNVNAPVNISYIAFNYKPLAKCIEDLANLINYDWFVDYDKDVHFFAKEETAAPFNILDNDGSYIYDSLIIRRDNTQIRNTIIVRGGEYIGSQTTWDIEMNGIDRSYTLPYKIEDFEATLTGDQLNVGQDNVDRADDYDALHNRDEKIIIWKEEDKPAGGNTLKVGGKPLLPVIVRKQDSASVNAMISAEGGDGVYEYLIEDKSIKSKEGARQRARAELYAYAQTLSEGEFTTYTSGLRAGQRININSVSRNFNEDYIINRVTINQFSKDTLIYKVSIVTTKTFDIIDVLQRLLLESTKKVEIKDGEVEDVAFDFTDEASFSDSISAFSTDNGPYTYFGGANDGEWNFATWT